MPVPAHTLHFDSHTWMGVRQCSMSGSHFISCSKGRATEAQRGVRGPGSAPLAPQQVAVRRRSATSACYPLVRQRCQAGTEVALAGRGKGAPMWRTSGVSVLPSGGSLGKLANREEGR